MKKGERIPNYFSPSSFSEKSDIGIMSESENVKQLSRQLKLQVQPRGKGKEEYWEEKRKEKFPSLTGFRGKIKKIREGQRRGRRRKRIALSSFQSV